MYLGNSLALASIELLVHLRSIDVLEAYCKMPVFIPESLVMHLDAALLPADWAASAGRSATMAIGDDWLRGGDSAVLQVPSAVVAGETNFILNPTHVDVSAIKTGPISEFGSTRDWVTRGLELEANKKRWCIASASIRSSWFGSPFSAFCVH